MEIPGLGEVAKNVQSDWYYSQPIAVPMFGARSVGSVLQGYDDDERTDDFRIAIAGTLAARLTRQRTVGHLEALREQGHLQFALGEHGIQLVLKNGQKVNSR